MHVMLMLHLLVTVRSAAFLRDTERGAGDNFCAAACAQRGCTVSPSYTGHACQRTWDAASRERSESARQLDLSHGAYRAPMRDVVLCVARRALGARNVCPRRQYRLSDVCYQRRWRGEPRGEVKWAKLGIGRNFRFLDYLAPQRVGLRS
jgi:hypothetical protein